MLIYPPRPHQAEPISKALPLPEFAMFSDMGTGKTYMTINIAWTRWERGEINKLLIICDSPIKNVWNAEFHKHIESDYETIQIFTFRSGMNKQFKDWTAANPDVFQVLIVGLQALSQGTLYKTIQKWPDDKTMVVIDESYDIKTPGSKRTQKCWNLGGRAGYRMILTGTPVGNGYEDYYAQFRFLNSKYLGSNFSLFKRKYCYVRKMDQGQGEFDKIVGYKEPERITKIIAPISYVIKKEDALPHLPPKEFTTIPIDPTKEQLRVLKDLKNVYEAQDNGKKIEISSILEYTLRCQQVAGGHFPFKDEDIFEVQPISGKNPKLEAVMSYLRQIPKDAKAIIWAQFVPEIELLYESIGEEFGNDSVGCFYGALDDNERAEATYLFRNNHFRRFMISNRVGAKGQTWTAATYVLYYSNDFSYVNRVQSEDRAHRDGQENKVMYVDFVLQHRDSDINVFNAIQKKQSLAQYASENLEQFT